jgi:hypothetical protein
VRESNPNQKDKTMNVTEIYNSLPKFLRKNHAFRMGNSVYIDRTIFINTLANAIGIDVELIQDNGTHYVITAA